MRSSFRLSDFSPQQSDGHLTIAADASPLSALELVSDPSQRNDLDVELRAVEFTGAGLIGFQDVAVVEGQVQVGATVAERHRPTLGIGGAVSVRVASDRK